MGHPGEMVFNFTGQAGFTQIYADSIIYINLPHFHNENEETQTACGGNTLFV